MSQTPMSLQVSHAKMLDLTTQLIDLLNTPQSEDTPWWGVLAALKDIAKLREIHINRLCECNLQLADIHWTVTPIIQAAIRCHRQADEHLVATRRELLLQMCVHRNIAQIPTIELQIQLLKHCEQLLEIAKHEKTNVFELFKIISANVDIPAAGVQ